LIKAYQSIVMSNLNRDHKIYIASIIKNIKSTENYKLHSDLPNL
jgi:hypothetical protein